MKHDLRRPGIPGGSIASLLRRRDGIIAVLMALLAVPIGAAAGIAIDVGRLELALHSAQGVADAAAMAGASLFTDVTKQQAALNAASNYVTQGFAGLPRFASATPATVVASPAPSCNAANAANTVTVSTTVTINTTLLWLFLSKLQSQVTATGAMPVLQMTLSMSGDDFGASVLDRDGMYWYPVPPDGGAPDVSDLHLLLSNGSAAGTGTVEECVSPTQQIGFAFSDEPGGMYNYGPNVYGGAFPDTFYYYSTLFPPSLQAYPDFPYDAALQIVAVNPDGGYPAPSTGFYLPDDPYGYGDFLATAEPLAPVAANGSVSCASLNGSMIHIYWNDMGGSPYDNLNYTDGEITFGCSQGQALLPYLMH